jgi:hypothetical protein
MAKNGNEAAARNGGEGKESVATPPPHVLIHLPERLAKKG